MKRTLLICFFCAFIMGLAHSQERKVLHLKEGWKFYKGYQENAFNEDFDDSKWEAVTVPHDWAIKGPFDDLEADLNGWS